MSYCPVLIGSSRHVRAPRGGDMQWSVDDVSRRQPIQSCRKPWCLILEKASVSWSGRGLPRGPRAQIEASSREIWCCASGSAGSALVIPLRSVARTTEWSRRYLIIRASRSIAYPAHHRSAAMVRRELIADRSLSPSSRMNQPTAPVGLIADSQLPEGEFVDQGWSKRQDMTGGTCTGRRGSAVAYDCLLWKRVR